jgi:hypothetical protein
MRSDRFFLGFLLVGMLLGGTALSAMAAPSGQKPFVDYGHPALEAINAAYSAGEISREEAVMYRAYMVLAPERLPERFALSGPVIKDATGILLELRDEMELLPAAMRGEIQALLVRPSLPDSREITHFVIHYDASLTDEAYVDVVADAAETAWTMYHSTLAWNVPPGDGSIGGGTNLTDCYIQQLGSGILGQAHAEFPYAGGGPNDYTGYFRVSHVIGSETLRQATVAHEYMHVVEFGYSALSTYAWWMENCAMRGEEWAFDDLNEYIPYLPPFFELPYYALDTHDGSYEYAQITWPMYLCERFYPESVENIWEEMRWLTQGSFWVASDTVLDPYGYTYESAYLEFKRWCYYTSSRDDGNHFEEGSTWNMSLAVDRAVSTFPSGEKHPRTERQPQPLGTSVCILVSPGGPANILEVTFNGPAVTLGVDFIERLDSGSCIEYSMSLDANGDGTISIPNFDVCSNVTMLTSMKRSASGAQDYAFWADTTYDASGVAELDSGNLIRIHPNFPNPFSLTTAIAYSLDAASNVQVRIVDATGRAVRNLYEGPQRPGNYEVTWNREDDAGRTVASGVYYAILDVGGRELSRQMTVLN